jgi:hypothetical protein
MPRETGHFGVQFSIAPKVGTQSASLNAPVGTNSIPPWFRQPTSADARLRQQPGVNCRTRFRRFRPRILVKFEDCDALWMD